MKYKVVIVDDKPLIRKSLCLTVNWESLECEVIAEADNGLEAKKIIEEMKPDILVSDIKMPCVDGLELTEYAKKVSPHTEVIIITGYQEFEYAKKAIELGVQDLVLKPIDNAELEAIIVKIITKIKEKSDSRAFQEQLLEENSRYRDRINSSIDRLRREFLANIISGKKVDNLQKRAQELQLDNSNFCVLMSRVRVEETTPEQDIIEKQMDYMQEYAKHYDMRLEDVSVSEDMVFVAQYSKSKSSRIQKIEMKNMVHFVNSKLKNEGSPECCFVISVMINDVRELLQCYENVKETMSFSYFKAEQQVIFTSYDYLLAPEKNVDFIKELDAFYREIAEVKKGECREAVDGILKVIVSDTSGNVFKVKCLISEICITLFRKNTSKFMDEVRRKEELNSIMNGIDKLADVKQAQKYLERFVEQIKEDQEKQQEVKNPIAVKAMEVIKARYMQNISLTSVAKELEVNSAYLSRLLKQEMGLNFVDILTKVRIDRAKQLLGNPANRVSEVGVKVGYPDYTYFYQVFKRIEKVSPSDYKKKVKKTNIL